MSLRREYERKAVELRHELLTVERSIKERITQLAYLGDQKERLINQQVELKKQFETDWWTRFSDYLRTGR